MVELFQNKQKENKIVLLEDAYSDIMLIQPKDIQFGNLDPSQTLLKLALFQFDVYLSFKMPIPIPTVVIKLLRPEFKFNVKIELPQFLDQKPSGKITKTKIRNRLQTIEDSAGVNSLCSAEIHCNTKH